MWVGRHPLKPEKVQWRQGASQGSASALAAVASHPSPCRRRPGLDPHLPGSQEAGTLPWHQLNRQHRCRELACVCLAAFRISCC